MYEVELKVRAAHGPVREALAARGATQLGTVRQDDTYYDAPHRSFAETDEALRLRRETRDEGEREDVTTRLTYKGPLVDEASKTREEAETAVADADATRTILDALGFTPAATVAKRRERFAHRDHTIALDTVADVGTFVEIERTVEDDRAIEPARDRARELLEDLGLDPDNQLRTSYLALALDAGAAGGAGVDARGVDARR